MSASPDSAREFQAREFRTTRWSLVERVRSADPLARRAALEALLGTYWPALYAYARALGEPAADAADLVQGYVAELLERGDLERLEREGGRLRAWLKSGLRHHRSHRRDSAEALRRGGAWRAVDFAEAERRASEDAGSDPELAFDRRFAEALLAAAYARLADECTDERSRALLAHLVASPDDASRAALERAHGLGAGAQRVALHRLRRRYAELVRAQIADGCADPAAVQQELAELRLPFAFGPADGIAAESR